MTRDEKMTALKISVAEFFQVRQANETEFELVIQFLLYYELNVA